MIEDIKFAVAHGRWNLALAGKLALPDMCAAIQSKNGKTTGSKYKNWVRAHLADKYPRLDPDELYQMRCSLLHQGTSSTIRYSRVISLPPESPVKIHNGIHKADQDSVLVLDLPTFCADVIGAVETWRASVKGHANYRNNIEKLMRWRQDGEDPLIVGMRVLS